MNSYNSTEWPDLAIARYEYLSRRNNEIAYEFVDLHVKMPGGTGPHAGQAEWVLNGILKIRTKDHGPN